jgi:DNA-binding NarL/FixJ family response regulator
LAGHWGSVVIADGDKASRSRVREALGPAGFETVEVATGREALAAGRGEGVSVLLLEVDLPDMSGYEVCRSLRDEGYDLPIFFVAGTHSDEHNRVAGLLLGADDFIVKPFERMELVARVRRVAERRGLRPQPEGNGNGKPSLTPRESEVLGLLARGSSQRAIANQLSISPKTVATHIQHLLGKLDAHSRAELVARAYLIGLVASAVTEGI